MNRQKFEANEIPYEELNEFGLTQEMVDDLPESIMDKLLKGQRTPLLPIERADAHGVVHKDFARIRLVKFEDTLHPLLLPVKDKGNLDYFTEEQKEALKKGDVLCVILPSNGTFNYVQLDNATGSIISAKQDIVKKNLSILTNDIGINDNDKMDLENGQAVTFGKEEAPITVGIDLNEETGILTVDGDREKWQEARDGNVKLDKYNFGIYGCWTKDDKGMLSYVPEDEYSDEMCKEQEAILEKARSSRGMHR